MSPGRTCERQSAKTGKISNKGVYSLERHDSNPFDARISWPSDPITTETAVSETGRRVPAAMKSRGKRTRRPRCARCNAKATRRRRQLWLRKSKTRLRIMKSQADGRSGNGEVGRRCVGERGLAPGAGEFPLPSGARE